MTRRHPTQRRPRRVRLSRRKGWKMPANTIVVSRPSRWGNPYRATTPDERRLAVQKFERFLQSARGRTLREEAISCLRGHNLACWCPLDGPCHADVLLELVNR
ncbi:MAG TPA: DUF4326 domain-containing protein [Lacunisphaera sp.]|nr:DUF4326 domain-containing protein [Lacunisphaera sp.]